MKKLVIANWKMNKTTREAQKFIDEYKTLNKGTVADVVICAPFTCLSILQGCGVKLGAQNFYHEKSGAYTGEISIEMLKELGVSTVLTGHSERRTLFGESDCQINKKVRTGITNGLRVVLCIGETLAQREDDETEKVLQYQLRKCLHTIDVIDKIVLAYEPVWAIGTGLVATLEQIERAHAFIKKTVSDIYPGVSIPVLYGGSVNENNSGAIMHLKNVDGVLVGGASLDAAKFSSIVKSVD